MNKENMIEIIKILLKAGVDEKVELYDDEVKFLKYASKKIESGEWK